MLGNGSRRCIVLDSQVVQLVDHGDIHALMAGLAMATVGAMAEVCRAGRACDGSGVVTLGLGGGLVADGVVHLLGRFKAQHDGGYGGTSEAVVDALVHGEGNAEGRTLGIQKASATKAFHDVDAHASLLAEVIDGRADGIHAQEGGGVGIGDRGTVCRRIHQQVISRIDAVQEDLHDTMLHRLAGNLGAMGGETDVSDAAQPLLLDDVVHKAAVQHRVPVVGAIHEMDHAEVDIVGMETGQKILKGLLDGGDVTHAEVTAVPPCRAQMSLNDPLFPILADGVSHKGADVGLGHEAVQHVDARLTGGVYHRKDLLLALALQPLTAKRDLTDGQACISQLSVLHAYIPLISVFPDGRDWR